MEKSSKTKWLLFNNLKDIENPFFEYSKLDKNRITYLNLQDFNFWKMKIKNL